MECRRPWNFSFSGRFVVCAAAMLALHSGVAAGPALDRIKASGKIVIAYLSSAPFAYADGDGKPMGYSIDLCAKVAQAVRKSLEMESINIVYLPVQSAQRIPTIVEGKADLECGSTTNNETRRKSVAFTIPHYITGARVAVRSDARIDKLSDFRGKKLISTEGGTALAAIKSANDERLLGIQIGSAATGPEAMASVESGRADGFAMDDVLLYALIADRPDPSKLKVVGNFLTVEPLAIMLPKDDPELKKIVDAEMKRLINSKEAHAIYSRWFEKPIPPKGKSLNMPMNYLLKDFWKYPNDWVPG